MSREQFTIYVHAGKDGTACTLEEPKRKPGVYEKIIAEPTRKPITEDFSGDMVAVGEVFNCNDVVPNLVHVA